MFHLPIVLEKLTLTEENGHVLNPKTNEERMLVHLSKCHTTGSILQSNAQKSKPGCAQRVGTMKKELARKWESDEIKIAWRR